jgi:uncharacterized membrane-anchored protein YjiN (DUF445 family)
MTEEVGIVTLLDRVQDDTATFTAEEVRRIIEHVNARAIDDIYNQSRIAAAMQATTERKARDHALLDALIASTSSTTRPALLSVMEVMNDEQTQADQA